jgi:PAS domain S-box-containing protein
MTFFPAVMVAAYLGGFWPGLLATLLSAAAANYFLTGQFPSFRATSVDHVVALICFVLVGTIISALCESLHRAQRRILAGERQRAEEALSQERCLLRALMDNVPDNIYFKDAASRFIRINKALASYFGLSDPVMAVGKTDFDFFTAEHARPAYTDEQEIMRTGQPVVGKQEKETWLDGRVRWVSTTKMPLHDQDGQIAGTFGVARDITKLKLAEEALRESEHRWRSLTEALPQLVWSATPDGACDYFSTQWTDHTGVPESELLGWRWLEVLHPDDREPTRELWTCSVCGCGPYDVEYRVRRSDGVYRWFKTRGVPIRDAGRNITKWFGTCTDITDLRQAEDALRESEERFRGTFENAAVGIALVDLNGRFVRVNQKYCDITGYSDAELLQKTFQDITPPDDLTISVQRFTALLRGDWPSFELKKRYLRKDGSLVWVELFASLERAATGDPAYAIAIVQDISERKRLVGELLKAKEVAEAANRAKDEFLANVSHEIRTPMNAILGMTELALDTQLTEDQRQNLTTVKSAADNLLGIINDLLDFSKIEAGKLELAPVNFSLRAALGDTVRALAMRAHKKGLELISDVQPDVHDALVGDAGRLRQILLNILGNAIKFTDEGEVVVRVETVRSEVVSGKLLEAAMVTTHDSRLTTHLRFTVRDTGIGIPKNKQDGIFRAFEQEDTSTTRKYGGTGLGLTISSRLVALMGGHITVDSEPGQGSTFAFTASFGLQPHPAEPTAAQPPILLHDMPVLIVDDNATNRFILREWLQGWQMDPAAAADGVAAMDALWNAASSGRPYPLMLLDARMPGTDGLTLAAQIRKRAGLSATRIILLSSGDRPADRDRSRELRIDARLLKPVQQDELLETVFRVLSRKESGAREQRSEGRERSTEDRESREKETDDRGQNSGHRDPGPFTTHHSPLTTSPPHHLAIDSLTPPLRILVAEDNEFNSQLLEQLLERHGYRVRLAKNGREALALLGVREQISEVKDQNSEVTGDHAASLTSELRPLTSDFDLLLLDVHMPELDGFQVAEAVRDYERMAGGHLPIVALTARARREDRERCLAAGMDDFLAKPIQAAGLWGVIERVAPLRSQRSGDQKSEDGDSQTSDLRPLTADPDLLDPQAVLAACGGDAGILDRISQAFRARLPGQMAEVRVAVDNGDASRLREAAHKLCGMMAAFSTVAGRVASEVEDFAAEDKIKESRPLVRQLETMAGQLMRAVDGISLEALRQQAESIARWHSG